MSQLASRRRPEPPGRHEVFDAVRAWYAKVLDALGMRPAVVAASLLVMVAAWPLPTFSNRASP